jgi:hypothetical protein
MSVSAFCHYLKAIVNDQQRTYLPPPQDCYEYINLHVLSRSKATKLNFHVPLGSYRHCVQCVTPKPSAKPLISAEYAGEAASVTQILPFLCDYGFFYALSSVLHSPKVKIKNRILRLLPKLATSFTHASI